MSDLVERLRAGEPCHIEKCRTIEAKSGCTCAEAADEIERLRSLLKETQPYVCWFLDKAENYGKARILNDKINAAVAAGN